PASSPLFPYTTLFRSKGRVAGVKFRDTVSGQAFEIPSSYVINAAGPWVDGLRLQNGSLMGKRLQLTKGVHLVFPHKKLPVGQSIDRKSTRLNSSHVKI